MSDDEQAFLNAIIAEPAEDTYRMAFADWLEEHDQTERAEFIRVQIELSRDYYQPNAFIDARFHSLVNRERVLFHQSPMTQSWFGSAFGLLKVGQDWYDLLRWFSRGFIHTVRGTLEDLRGRECRRCDGRGHVNVGKGFEDSEQHICDRCNGFGVTGGLLIDVIKTNPVEVVEVTDRKPSRDHRDPQTVYEWSNEGDGLASSNTALPEKLLVLMMGHGLSLHKWFYKEAIATAALSAALLEETRERIAAQQESPK